MQIICHGLKEEDYPVEFADHKIFLGRDASNSISLSAEGVSKYHAILIEENGELFLQDNDSMNGTFLNYNRIRSRQKLAEGDIIQIGYCLIKVNFNQDRNVVLDFVPPEQTENAEAGNEMPVEPAPSSGDAIGHTLVMTDTADSGSSAQPPGPMPFSGDDIDHTMIAPETPFFHSSRKGKLQGGSELGKYIIIKRIGKGGMGEVYLAKHKTLATFCAVKVLLDDSKDDARKFVDRFIREAKLASEIRHPNVVGVMDVETDSAFGFPTSSWSTSTGAA